MNLHIAQSHAVELPKSLKPPRALEDKGKRPQNTSLPLSTRVHRKRCASEPQKADEISPLQKHKVAPLNLSSTAAHSNDCLLLSKKTVLRATSSLPSSRNTTPRTKIEGSARPFESPLIQENSRLTLMSPHLKARRAELFASEAVTPLYTLQLNILKESSEAAQFDREFKASLRQSWEYIEKPSISGAHIEKLIHLACRRELEALFTQAGSISIEEFYCHEFQRTNEVLNILKRNGVPIMHVLKRLKLLHAETCRILEQMKLKTEFTELLYETMERLMRKDFLNAEKSGLNEGKKLSHFLKIIDDIHTQHKYKKIKPWIMRGFGDSEKTVKEVMGVLRQWNAPNEILIFNLKTDVAELSKRNIKIRSIPYVSHLWKEKKGGLDPFRSMCAEDIFKSFKDAQGHIVFDRITVNGTALHDRLTGQAFNTQLSSSQFFFTLFSALRGFLNERNPFFMETRAQVAHFMERCGNRQALLLQDEKSIPCLQVLKLASEECWKIAEKFMSFLYPQLFSEWKELPYVCKLLNSADLHCDIEIENAQRYRVTLTKTYGVFPVHYRDNKAIVHVLRRLAKIPFAWSIDFDKKSWHGTLRILKEFAIEAAATEQEKWTILDSMANYSEMPFNLRKFASTY